MSRISLTRAASGHTGGQQPAASRRLLQRRCPASLLLPCLCVSPPGCCRAGVLVAFKCHPRNAAGRVFWLHLRCLGHAPHCRDGGGRQWGRSWRRLGGVWGRGCAGVSAAAAGTGRGCQWLGGPWDLLRLETGAARTASPLGQSGPDPIPWAQGSAPPNWLPSGEGLGKKRGRPWRQGSERKQPVTDYRG